MNVAADTQLQLAEETLRLLDARDYPAAVISAVTHLDALLREALEKDETLPGRAYAHEPKLILLHGASSWSEAIIHESTSGFE